MILVNLKLFKSIDSSSHILNACSKGDSLSIYKIKKKYKI